MPVNPGDRSPSFNQLSLPEMVFDGIEAKRMEALISHAQTSLLQEDEIASQDFKNVSGLLAATAALEAEWRTRLGTRGLITST